MIDYKQFSKLKFSDFFSGDLEVIDTPDWEWMNTTWFIEGVAFSWIGQPFDEKDRTGGLELDLESLPPETVESIFKTLEFPIEKGDDEKKINSILGTPLSTLKFVEDRITNEYVFGDSDKYYISCTITNDEGFIFLSIMKYEIYEKYNEVDTTT